MYIHQLSQWPNFTWYYHQFNAKLGNVRYRQGKILGQMSVAGFNIREEVLLQTLTLDVVKSSEIEGEIFNPEQVRSSIAKRLGIEVAGTTATDRHIEEVVDMMLDATQNYDTPLTENRLYNWHGALFPTGRSGLSKITVAEWRTIENGPMQVVSGVYGREKVHFQAPDADIVPRFMDTFLNWFEEKQNIDPVLKAAVAHLWFVTIHPFDDGNGRITRALTDMQLSRADQTEQRFFSMSAQIQKERAAYYDILECTQKGTLDITNWIVWFLDCLDRSMDTTTQILNKIETRGKFWEAQRDIALNSRQQKMITIMLDDFFGSLNVSKWAKMTNCSTDTALRDIQNLVSAGILLKEDGGGRNTSYKLVIN